MTQRMNWKIKSACALFAASRLFDANASAQQPQQPSPAMIQNPAAVLPQVQPSAVAPIQTPPPWSTHTAPPQQPPLAPGVSPYGNLQVPATIYAPAYAPVAPAVAHPQPPTYGLPPAWYGDKISGPFAAPAHAPPAGPIAAVPAAQFAPAAPGRGVAVPNYQAAPGVQTVKFAQPDPELAMPGFDP